MIYLIFKKFVLIVFIVILLTGCWGHTELSEKNLVSIIGIDYIEGGDVQITALVDVPTGSVVSPSIESSVWIGKSTGNSLEDAIVNLYATANRKLVLYHNRIIIVGYEASKNGVIKEIADYAARSRELRLTQKILVAEGDASELLSIPADVLSELPKELEGLTGNWQEWSKSYVPNMSDFLSDIANEYVDTLVGRIGYNMTNRNTYSTNRQEARNESLFNKEFGMAYVEGSAVIKDDKLAGFLNDTHTRGCLLVMNKLDGGDVSSKYGDQKLVLEHKKYRSTIKPQIEDGNLSVNIEVIIKGELTQAIIEKDVLKLPTIKEMERIFEEQIISEISSVVEVLQDEMKADVLGFGSAYRRKYPNQWREIESDWSNIFPMIEVNYDVMVVIRRFGTISNTVVD